MNVAFWTCCLEDSGRVASAVSNFDHFFVIKVRNCNLTNSIIVGNFILQLFRSFAAPSSASLMFFAVCGRTNRKAARLLGGENTESHEFPWLANIHTSSGLLVSGVLINDRYIMTAASELVGLVHIRVVSVANIEYREVTRYIVSLITNLLDIRSIN